MEQPDSTSVESYAQPEDLQNTRFFGDYELLCEIGRGGMGVVYQARQLGTQRTVALKFLSGGALAARDAVHRFHTEAQAAALLEHPGIVPIYEAGMHDGQYFLAMRFLGGGTLADLANGSPLSPRRSAEITATIAAAVQFAHSRGVLHRDLKPGNILLDDAGAPLVSDFGLARLLESEERLTLSSAFLGTAAYVAPEQMMGTCTIASDIYGLGAVLYELLAGKPPFQRPSFAATLRALQEEEPVPPSKVLDSAQDLPPDLETICLKCLQKAPAKRYATAQALADDLTRFLHDEPILARPTGPTDKLRLWCKRKPTLATLGAAVLVLLLVVVVGAPITIVRINAARLDAERSLYAADMRLASDALRNGAIEQVQELLDRHKPNKGAEDLRGFEWRYLRHAADQSGLVTHQLTALKASKSISDPRLILTGGALYNLKEETDQVLAWDMTTWGMLPLQLPLPRASEQWRWYPDQRAALAINEQSRMVALHRLPTFEQVSTISIPGQVSRAAVSKDLAAVALAFQGTNIHAVQVWDVAANSQGWVFEGHGGEVRHLAFTPDGKVLMAAYDDGTIGLWSITEHKVLPSPERNASNPNEDWLQPPFFGRDSMGLYLNRGRDRKTLEVWDWSTRRLSTAYQARFGELDALAFSPDGASLATAWSGDLIVLLDTKQSGLIGAIPLSGSRMLSLAFSPSGRLLISGSEDRTAKLWDMKTQRALATLGGNEDSVRDVAFTPDEKSVLTLTGDGIIKVWDLRALTDRDVLWRGTNAIRDLSVSSDERTIATLDSQGWIRVWDRVRGAEIRSVQTGGPNGNATAFAMSFSPTEHVLTWAGWSSLELLNYDLGQTNSFPLAGRFGFCGPAFSPDGRELAFADGANIRLLDMATRKPRLFAPVEKRVFGLAISPDGSLLAAAHAGGSITLWDRASGCEITNVLAHPPEAHDVEFSPDGRLLASAGVDATGKLWDVTPSGLKHRYTLHGHVGWVTLVFSPDGRRVLSSGGGDKAWKLWDTKTGLETGTIHGRGGRIVGVAFSRDGNSVYSASEDGDVSILRAPPPDQLEALVKEKKVNR
jgi:WD40 repeat protein